ncbi:hypothetical protein [Aurantiacibacter odishensis]|uniref:hypothetical protein n=1 Tax=Aurantiacibacter odishensis TaxID=1155476 RepID=UPI000E73AE7C|nr:hypothetical protein [Aurantiacibacter odishensis]
MIRQVALAGFVYFVTLFAAGFILGTLRVLLVVPQVGEVAAIAMELPVMLLIAWFACGWILSNFQLVRKPRDSLLMGAIALILLLLAEAVLAVTLFGSSLLEYFQSYSETGPMLGLAAQILSAGFPLIRTRRY